MSRVPKSLPTGRRPSPIWFAHPVRLKETSIARLTKLLGPKAQKEAVGIAVERVRALLGGYEGAVAAIDYAPRPTDYVARIRPLRKIAWKLVNIIENLDSWTREALTSKLQESGIDPDARKRAIGDVSAAIAHFGDACGAVLLEHSKRPSGGRPKRGALDALVTELRSVFAQYSRGWNRIRPGRGAFVTHSEYEINERKFVLTALGALRDTTAQEKRRRRADQEAPPQSFSIPTDLDRLFRRTKPPSVSKKGTR